MIGFEKAINNGFASHNEFVKKGGGAELLKCLGIENFLTNLTIFFSFPYALSQKKPLQKGLRIRSPATNRS